MSSPEAAQDKPATERPPRRLLVGFERYLILITTAIALTSAGASVLSTYLSARQLDAGYESIRINNRNARFEAFFTAGNEFCRSITPDYVRERYFAQVRENVMADGSKKLASIVRPYDLRAALDEPAMRVAMNSVGAKVESRFNDLRFHQRMFSLWSDIDLAPAITELTGILAEALTFSPEFQTEPGRISNADGKLDGNKIAKIYAENEFRCRQTIEGVFEQFFTRHIKT